MMATIEPRLIHLLNESTTPQLQHSDLPTRSSLPLPKLNDRSLPPLSADTITRNTKPAADGQAVNSLAPLYYNGDEGSYDPRKDGTRFDLKYAPSGAIPFPLRLVLDDNEVAEPSHSLSRIFGDVPDLLEDSSNLNKKRHRGLHSKDDFVQLPQPLKKQKAAQQTPVMPPIINGLHEPPPHAAMFPPISDEGDKTQIKSFNDLSHYSHDRVATQSPADIDKAAANKARKRATKPRRKWSEEETNHLLLGVNRHGVGKWTSILEDPDFKFNERTAGDLKNRFRTCCPDELRRSKRGGPFESDQAESRGKKQKQRVDAHLEKILIDSEELSQEDKLSPALSPSDSSRKPRKSRAHRKKMEDLAELGIHGPFKKSHRRERRPFTDQDDQEILEGLNLHGPAWTKIQRNPRFHLSTRQPTDLRDRVRNKYPAIYQRIEKGTFQVKESGRGNDLLEPSVTMTIDNSLQPAKGAAVEPQMNRSGSKEDLPRWPLQILDSHDTTQLSSAFEYGGAPAAQLAPGDMDLSRLLLDDSNKTRQPSRVGLDGVSGPASPAGLDLRTDRSTNQSSEKDHMKGPAR